MDGHLKKQRSRDLLFEVFAVAFRSSTKQKHKVASESERGRLAVDSPLLFEIAQDVSVVDVTQLQTKAFNLTQLYIQVFDVTQLRTNAPARIDRSSTTMHLPIQPGYPRLRTCPLGFNMMLSG